MHPHHFAKAASGLLNAGGSRFLATPRDASQMKDYAFEMAGEFPELLDGLEKKLTI